MIDSHSYVEKILIAEDHELYSDGISLLLQEMMPAVTIDVADNYPDALSKLKQDSDISLLLLDIKLPGTTRLNGLKEIKSTFPTLTIIVVSTLDFDISIREIIALGANGFIAKSTTKSEIKDAITNVLKGKLVIKSEKDGSEYFHLSERQLETLHFLAEGKSNKEIAKALNIAPSTVKEYVSKIISLLNVDNRTQAILKAQKVGLLIDHL